MKLKRFVYFLFREHVFVQPCGLVRTAALRLLISFQVFFTVMVGSILAGQAGPSMQGIASARGAAYHVYELINRVSILPAVL